MAHAPDLAERLLDAVAPPGDSPTRPRLGGDPLIWRDDPLARVTADDLMAQDGDEWAQQPGAGRGESTGRPMRGMVTAADGQVAQPEQARDWASPSAAVVSALPAK